MSTTHTSRDAERTRAGQDSRRPPQPGDSNTLGRDRGEPAAGQALLQGQFRLPRGILGRLVGWFMARDNQAMNRASVKLLHVGSDDDVLEIGFGPGQAIELLVKRTAARFIAGVDPSEVMVQQALERNRESVDAGRVVLVQGTVDRLPFDDERFSKAFAVSNFGIWPSPGAGLAEIRRVLRPGGTLLLCLRRAARRPGRFTSPGLTRGELASAQQLLADAGFCDVRQIDRKLGSRIVCLVGQLAGKG